MADELPLQETPAPEAAAPVEAPTSVEGAPVSVEADAAPAETATPEAVPESDVSEGAAPDSDAPDGGTPESEPTLLERAKAPGAEDDDESEVEAKTDDEAETADGEGDEKTETEAEAKAESDDAKDVAEADDKDAAPEAAPLEPVEYKYELPETLKMDDEAKEATHSALDAFRADPSNPQPLIDLHAQMLERHNEMVRQEQWDVFNQTRKQWRDEVLADPEIGGAGHHTAMQAIARMRDRFASSARPGTKQYDADLQAFDGMLRATGVGDHPVYLKVLHNIARVYDEPPMGPTNVTPAPQKGGPRVLYDNPRSGMKQ